MDRAEKRRKQRELDKAKEQLEKLSPEALKIIESYCRSEAEEKLELYKKLVDNAVFNAMRENRVGELRAYRIMEQANELIKSELGEKNNGFN